MEWKKLQWSKMTGIACLFLAATAVGSPAQTFRNLVSFDGADGANPQAGLVLGPDGNFYGTANGGGANGDGTVFKVTIGGRLTTLYNFCSQGGDSCTDGANPEAGLVLGHDGNLYGTTLLGGANGDGTVFKITLGGRLTTLHSFDGSDGANPLAGLVLGPDGNFYGTASAGGADGDGTVFKVTREGSLTTLHSFDGTDGASPYDAALLLGPEGNFYGTTLLGGANGIGTVFKINLGGTLTTLHSFDGTDGAIPWAGLALGVDGNLYGTTLVAGANMAGTLFKITPRGTLTTLYNFCSQGGDSCTDGKFPQGELLLGADGNFYGTTVGGGVTAYGVGFGTVFNITPRGTLTTLYTFCSQASCTDGVQPSAGLLLGSDRNFYSTASAGGASGDGTVFSLRVPPYEQ